MLRLEVSECEDRQLNGAYQAQLRNVCSVGWLVAVFR